MYPIFCHPSYSSRSLLYSNSQLQIAYTTSLGCIILFILLNKLYEHDIDMMMAMMML